MRLSRHPSVLVTLFAPACAPFVDCVLPLIQSHLAPGSTSADAA